MTTEKYPLFFPGVLVRTTQANLSLRVGWTDAIFAKLKWGVMGTILTKHNFPVPEFDIQHEDGTEARYDATEIEIMTFE